LQAVFDIEVPRMAFGRVRLIGDAAFALRPHAAAGTAKAADDAWTLGQAVHDCAGNVVAALDRLGDRSAHAGQTSTQPGPQRRRPLPVREHVAGR
jgi:2-polyprenyl-6-methoxyphenol hydroxylase-like FAD-dependent oxidoreductase